MSPILHDSEPPRKSSRLTEYFANEEQSLSDDESLNKVIEDIFAAFNDDLADSRVDDKPRPIKTRLLPCWSGSKCPSELISIMIGDR